MIETQQLVVPYKETKKKLANARKKYRALKAALVKRLEEARGKLSAKEDRDLILDLVRNEMAQHLDEYVAAHRQEIITTAETWWDKYAVPMDKIQRERESAANALSKLVHQVPLTHEMSL